MVTTPRSASLAGRELVFDAAFLQKLEQLELVARKMFRGLMRGEHASSRRGRGLEFSEFTRYRAGDDFRHIDWNIYSRLDQLFIRLHASEEDVTLHLIVDASASMDFGEPSKFDHARRLAAALACIALHNFDRVGVSTFADKLGAGLPSRKARQHLASVLAFLRDLPCAGRTHFETALRSFAARTRTPGLVVLISDLLGAADLREGIQALRRGGHDVVVIQLLAQSEIDPPLDGALRLVDAETGCELDATVDEALRARYRDRLRRYLEEVESTCRRQGVEYLRVSTAIPFEDVVLKCLREGGHLR